MRSLVFGLMLGLGILPAVTRADTVVLGSDYLHTTTAFFDFGAPVNSAVSFQSNPVGPGNTDTIVQRQADATLGGGPIPIQITELSMVSTAPVNVGGINYNVFVTLDPNNLPNDTGTMSITGTAAAGGAFSSTLDVFFLATFEPVGGGVSIPITGEEIFTGSGLWSPTPPAGAVIVPGAVGDQNANMHTGLSSGQSDFFISGLGLHVAPNGGHTVVTAFSIPEPSTWIMLVTAGLIVPVYTKLGRRRA